LYFLLFYILFSIIFYCFYILLIIIFITMFNIFKFFKIFKNKNENLIKFYNFKLIRCFHFNMQSQNIFVDTNMLIYFEKYYYGSKTDLNTKIYNLLLNNNIFYNETVNHEYYVHKKAIKEFPKNIQYFNSGLNVKDKQLAFDDLKEILQKRLLTNWNELEIEKMRNDMFIIFEASYSCYKIIDVNKGEIHPFFL